MYDQGTFAPPYNPQSHFETPYYEYPNHTYNWYNSYHGNNEYWRTPGFDYNPWARAWAQTSTPNGQEGPKDQQIMEISKGVPTELGLSGTLADSDEYKQTLESLKSAESLTGKNMAKPVVDNTVYQSGEKGSKVQDLLQDNQRITAAEIDKGMMDEEESITEMAQQKQKDAKIQEI